MPKSPNPAPRGASGSFIEDPLTGHTFRTLDLAPRLIAMKSAKTWATWQVLLGMDIGKGYAVPGLSTGSNLNESAIGAVVHQISKYIAYDFTLRVLKVPAVPASEQNPNPRATWNPIAQFALDVLF